ncbi:MAG: hypothetical protein LC792_14080 [Actinobacteria bacterium]|nr:hypothetical protein [Actinomycetota bacterium]
MPRKRKNPPRKTPDGKSPDELVNKAAARRRGALTGTQARKAGLSQRQIDYRVQTKRWRRWARDVYVLAGTPQTWQQEAVVACLAGPPGTVTSHLTAAAVYGLAKAPKEPQVTIPRDANGARIRGARVRRVDLRSGDKAVRDCIPCTTAVQTVIDCAEVLDSEALCDLVDSALCRKLMQPSRLIRAAEAAWRSARRSRRAALGRLLEALEVWRSGAQPGSPPEAKLQRRLKEWGFPPAQRQVKVHDKDGRFLARADLGIVEWKVLLEYDSDEHHGPRCWIADGERLDRVEEEAGWRMVSVDRFDLRPSNTNLRDRLEKLRPPETGPIAA